MKDTSTHFVIVTPSYNLENFIEQTILSVISQAGDFTIRYHIQDGGSNDGTLAILKKWQAWMDEGKYPIFCRGIEFSHVVEKDNGMYQAINLGFAHARPGPDSCVMAWINADDLLPPGALAAICSFLDYYPSASFFGGRTTLMSETGFLAGLYDPLPRLRSDIAEGYYSGGSSGYMQQEGIFWKSELWDKVGGIDESLRLAGDLDLWMKLALHAEYYPLDTLTGIHRKREGQLSSAVSAYDEEVKQLLQGCKTVPPLPQDLVGYCSYDLQEKSWVRVEQVSGQLMTRFSVDMLDDAIEFARAGFRKCRRKKMPPWFLTAEGWRFRSLRNQLIRARDSQLDLIKERLNMRAKSPSGES